MSVALRKRPASFQAGPVPKKVHLDKALKGTPKKEKADKKRSRPITMPLGDASDESDVDINGEFTSDSEDEVKEHDVVSAGGAVHAREPNARFDTPPAARESHKSQKTLHSQRRAAKPHSRLLLDAKRVWSLVRQKNISTTDRQKYVEELIGVIRGRLKDIVLKHDASRIVQSVVKYGTQKQREEIAEELKGMYRDLAQNRYSKFLVTKLIRLSPAHRPSILLEFQSHVLRLLLHREASGVLADAFELYANAYERTILLRDFYGKETTLFSVTAGSGEDKERAKKGLKGILDGLSVDRRKRVLDAVKKNLVQIFNNPDKGAVTHAVVHRALWEYLLAINEIEDEVEQDKLRREIFESCQELLAEMVHTKDGSRIVREFIVQGNAKDRKQIVKILKPHVERMCTHDEASNVLFTALDVIDDTKLTAKSLVTDITSRALTLSTDPQGRRALLYLLVPRTRRHFTPSQINTLSETDAIRAKTSKKDELVRREEIRKAASEALIEFVEQKGSVVARDTGGSLVIAEIMLHAEGDKTAAMESLLKPLSSPYPSKDKVNPHPIDLPHASRLYKTLLQGGHFSRDTNSIVRCPSNSPSMFASAFVKFVGKETILAMAKGDGAFLVAELLERLMDEGILEEKAMVRGWFGKQEVDELKSEVGKGRGLLLGKVQALQ